jgi:hypothetical protein
VRVSAAAHPDSRAESSLRGAGVPAAWNAWNAVMAAASPGTGPAAGWRIANSMSPTGPASADGAVYMRSQRSASLSGSPAGSSFVMSVFNR